MTETIAARDPVDYTLANGVATVRLNSPANRNALSATLVDAIRTALAHAAARPDVHAVVLGHHGSTFCSGVDLIEAREGGMQAGTERMLALLNAIVELPVPVLGQIDGHVRAGGMGIIGACDLVFAGPAASFAFTEARLGLAPAVIALTVLPKMAPQDASLYLLTGRRFDAQAAVRMGLVTDACADTDACLAPVLAELAGSPRQGLQMTKRVLTASTRTGLHGHGARAVQLSTELFGSDQAQAKMAEFLARTAG